MLIITDQLSFLRMIDRKILWISLILFGTHSLAQESPDIMSVSIQQNSNFGGYDLLDNDSKLYVLAEHWHNIRMVPRATMKTLRYLHKEANVRILAIEQGKSAAMMINQFLETGDTIMLQHITRNTMFWGKENRRFFKDLRNYNSTLSDSDKILVSSIDIEYKMESAVFMINQFIGSENIPESLTNTVGEFKRIYESTLDDREQYDGLAVMYYYERIFMENLVNNTINDLEKNSQKYIDFFGDRFSDFATMILEMDDGLTFDYTNPNNNYKFRDRIILENFLALIEANPSKSILCPIGMRHATNFSSIRQLKEGDASPIKEKVSIIRITALYNKMINAQDLRRINYNYPGQLKVNEATLIRHTEADPGLTSRKGFDYTLFLNSNGNLTPYENILTE